MNRHRFDDQPDQELAEHLRALHELPMAPDVTALRSRILEAASAPLAVRSRRTMRAVARPTWLDVTGGFGRIAIPLSLAAALLAMVLLRQLPVAAETEDPTLTLAYDLTYRGADESGRTPSIAEQLLLPENADEVLLAPVTPKVTK
ncbi:MAG: hypothetical protein IPP90_07135 [Gemmatimonadaceae bacterium]|nr:hypothetical protein [Gemmatimonadaceae bacterium]